MEVRLHKLIAEAGIASRRKAEDLIRLGLVTVNGQVVTKLGAKADPERDHIKVRGKLINPLLRSRKKVYIVLNKPKGYLSSLSDPQGRPLVTQLLPPLPARVHPVGRLDFNTEGLLLLTNDGEFTHLITSAKFHIPKVYHVKVKGIPDEKALNRLRRGVVIDGKRTAPCEIVEIERTRTNAWYAVTLYQELSRQIRKMFDLIGHSVIKLRRVAIGFLTDEGLKPGMWRYLTPEEVDRFFAVREGKKIAPVVPMTIRRTKR
jgi:23S rRNA pseudouridine2605 synthase